MERLIARKVICA